MTIQQFIKKHRVEIDEFIHCSLHSKYRLNDEEREQWILNDEGLYLWAKSEGVKI